MHVYLCLCCRQSYTQVDTELEQTNLKKFKCQGYCLGGEC